MDGMWDAETKVGNTACLTNLNDMHLGTTGCSGFVDGIVNVRGNEGHGQKNRSHGHVITSRGSTLRTWSSILSNSPLVTHRHRMNAPLDDQNKNTVQYQ